MIELKKIRNRADKQKKLQDPIDNSNESKDKNLRLLSEENNQNADSEFGMPEVNQRYSSSIAIHERSIPDPSAPQF